jgi:hypothetical protein
MDEVDLLLTPLPEELLDLVTAIGKRGGHRRRGKRFGCWLNQRMPALVAEGTITAIRMLTVSADKLSMKRLTAFLAVLSVVTIVNPTFRALHQESPPASRSL